MKRDIEKEFKSWKVHENRLPLLIRGARQTGKTYIVEKFGRESFSNVVTINFELQEQLKKCFESLDPIEIINKIQLLLNVNIVEEKTLLFFDEIQECPRAIMALRYFKEKKPNLHVIGAGSLLEFVINEDDFRMPVGRIQFIYLKPLSFGEFLDAFGHDKLRSYLTDIEIRDKIDDVIHNQLLSLIRQYFILGGMPAVLDEYLKTKDMIKCQNIQIGILETYRSDFGKYSKRTNYKYLQRLFESAPRLIGQRIKYVDIDPVMKSRELKQALDLLTLAGLVQPVYTTTASGLPLGAQINERKFKMIFLDIGLAQNACGLQAEINLKEDILQVNAGSIAEQFVGQELISHSNKYENRNLYFWAREKRGSSAEVDFIISIGSKIYPVEVKSGKTGTLKSLKLFLKEKKSSFGIRFSRNTLSYYDQILSIPLYMIEQVSRLAQKL